MPFWKRLETLATDAAQFSFNDKNSTILMSREVTAPTSLTSVLSKSAVKLRLKSERILGSESQGGVYPSVFILSLT